MLGACVPERAGEDQRQTAADERHAARQGSDDRPPAEGAEQERDHGACGDDQFRE